MVDVKPTSAKLRRRAAALVESLGRVGARRAAALLDEARGSTKTAIVMARRGCTLRQARALLAKHGGRLRDALAE